VPPEWSTVYDKQLRSALTGACKRLSDNAEAQFHLGLMHLRGQRFADAAFAFKRAKTLLCERVGVRTQADGDGNALADNAAMKTERKSGGAGGSSDAVTLSANEFEYDLDKLESHLRWKLARVDSHLAQAVYLAARNRAAHDFHGSDAAGAQSIGSAFEASQLALISTTEVDPSQSDAWNALALLHLSEAESLAHMLGDSGGARHRHRAAQRGRKNERKDTDVDSDEDDDPSRGTHSAKKMLQSIASAVPAYLDAHSNLGLTELQVGSDGDAALAFQEVIVRDRTHVEALCNYGVMLVRHGLFDHAKRPLCEALRAASSHLRALRCRRSSEFSASVLSSSFRGVPFAWGALAVAHAGLREWQLAERAAHAAERSARGATERSRFTALLLSIQARKIAYAPTQAKSAVPVVTPNEGVENQTQSEPRACATGIQSLSSGATESTNSMRQTGSVGVVVSTGEGGVTSSKGSLETLIARLRNQARESKSSCALLSLGNALRLRQEVSGEEAGGNRSFGAEAAERFVETLERQPRNVTAWVQLAILQLSCGEYVSARKMAKHATRVRSDSGLAVAHAVYGVASQLLGDCEAAENSYNTALQLINDQHSTTTAQHHQAALAAGTHDSVVAPGVTSGDVIGNDTDRASEELSELTAHSISAVYNNIGNLLRQRGREHYADALVAFEKALAVGGDSAVIHNNIAITHIANNCLEKADEEFRAALSLESSFECAQSNLLKLRAYSKRQSEPTNHGHRAELVETPR